MKHTVLGNWQGLTPYGVEPLTGEACGLMYRILCDVTAKGREVLGKCLGVPGINLPPAWNRGSAEDPHVGCFMAAPELFVPLAVFALLEAGHKEVYLMKDGAVLGFKDEPTAEDLRVVQIVHGGFARGFRYGGTAGDRNVHEMSGRVV